MKFIVVFTLLGIFLSSAYAADRPESEISQEDDKRSEHPNNFSGLVETTMDLMGPDSPTTQNSDQLAVQVSH